MHELNEYASNGSFQAVLEGGPADLPTALRSPTARRGQEKIKVPYLGGYEHFERSDADDEPRVTYRWTMRTKIAE